MNVARAMSRTRVAIVLLCLLVGASVVLVFVQAPWASAPGVKQQRFEVTRSAFQGIAMTTPSSYEDVVRAFDAMTIESQNRELDRGTEQKLRRTVARAVYEYWFSREPTSYRAWRESMWCSQRQSSDDQLVGWDITVLRPVLERYSNVTEEPLPDTDEDFAAIFDYTWRVREAIGDGANRARHMSSDRVGLNALITQAESGLHPRPTLQGSLGSLAWYGGSSISARRWFIPDVSMQQVIDQHGHVTIATIGVVAEFHDGIRRPIIYTLYWVPRRGEWYLHNAASTNVPETHPTWPVEL